MGGGMTVSKPIAVVTGVSHSKGIGAAICRRLAQDGVSIFFIHWDSHDGWEEEFSSEIQQWGVNCLGMACDLGQVGIERQIFDKVTEEMGVPTILINNAAHSRRDGFDVLSSEIIDEHYVVNMRAKMLLSVEFARRFKRHGLTCGRIVQMISGQEQGPMPHELAYVATKGAISAFTLSLSAEVAPLGITVNAVNPGPTDTGWMTEEIKDALQPKFLMGRIGQPDDAARIVTFLTSEEANWITGQVIHSEGGFFRS